MSKFTTDPKHKGRPTERIKSTLDTIHGLWACFPDLRLGQLLTNVLPQGVDIFYVEEEDLKRYINEYYFEHVH